MATHRQYGLIGRKLGHSFSRDYFTRKFAVGRIDAEYLNFELPDIGGLPGLLASRPQLRGFNVTIPYKQSVMPLLDGGIDPVAEAVGAVNTVRRMPSGSLRGYNTDAPAFAESLRRMAGAAPLPQSALVLGTGGASRAVSAALRAMGVEVVFVSRTPGSGCIAYAEADGEVVRDSRLIVNCTPLGMWPDILSAPDIDYTALTPQHLCFDLVYNPDPTVFMRLAAAHGARVRSGLEMLRLQAEGAWRIWQGDEPASIDYSKL